MPRQGRRSQASRVPKRGKSSAGSRQSGDLDRDDVVAGSGGLQKKYQQLCAKYEVLVRKFEKDSARQLGIYQLGAWALHTSTSGLALVRKGAVSMTNRRWQELDTRVPKIDARWELLGAPGPPQSYGSLREIAVVSAQQVLARADVTSQVTRYRRGKQIMEVWAERLGGSGGNVSLLVHDVTEQLRAEAELRTAREALHRRHRLEGIGELASGIAHDLNNALNVMRLRIALLEHDLAPAQKKHADALARIVEDAAVRVARVHDLSRKNDDDRLETVELQHIVAEAVALAKTELEQHEMIGGRRFRLVANVPALAPVQANAAELKHAFVNLIFNARDAMALGGTITIEGRREDDHALISVADEGTGIPDEDLDRIFDPFFTTKGQSGTGLGLSMARGAMARMGGSITAQNRQGGGAEFLLRFPLATARALPAEPRRLSPPAAPARDVRVLLIDDDADCLDVTAEVLEREGVTVDKASSGSEALQRVPDREYDLLLCDVGMPEMSGWEVARRFRERRPGIAIYMMTGWAEEYTSSGTRPVSVDGLLGKPLSVEELRSVVADVARRPRASEATEASAGLRQL